MALVVLAAAIYAALIVREISVRTESGTERRAHAQAGHGSPQEEAILGAIWAHEHHPPDASWGPDYSPMFQRGCAEAVAGIGADPADRP